MHVVVRFVVQFRFDVLRNVFESLGCRAVEFFLTLEDFHGDVLFSGETRFFASFGIGGVFLRIGRGGAFKIDPEPP